MKYSRKVLLDALQTRLGVDYMQSWTELKFCAIPELCATYSKYAFIFLQKYNDELCEYGLSARTADYIVRVALEELLEKGYLEFGSENSFV